MVTYTYSKAADTSRLILEIVAANLTAPQYIDTIGTTLNLNYATDLSLVDKAALDVVVTAHVAVRAVDTLDLRVKAARDFGISLIIQFAAENLALGITQAGMTSTVRKNMEQVVSALTTGSLYDAIAETKALPLASKDLVFITDVRLLQYVNKIETYLGIPLSTSL